MIKRLVAFTLAFALAVISPLSALAETPGGGSTIGRIPVSSGSSAGYKPNKGTYKDMGFRVTITTPFSTPFSTPF